MCSPQTCSNSSAAMGAPPPTSILGTERAASLRREGTSSWFAKPLRRSAPPEPIRVANRPERDHEERHCGQEQLPQSRSRVGKIDVDVERTERPYPGTDAAHEEQQRLERLPFVQLAQAGE